MGRQVEADGEQLPDALLACLEMIAKWCPNCLVLVGKVFEWNDLSEFVSFVICHLCQRVRVPSSRRTNSMLADASQGTMHYLIGWTLMRTYVSFIAHSPNFNGIWVLECHSALLSGFSLS